MANAIEDYRKDFLSLVERHARNRLAKSAMYARGMPTFNMFDICHSDLSHRRDRKYNFEYFFNYPTIPTQEYEKGVELSAKKVLASTSPKTIAFVKWQEWLMNDRLFGQAFITNDIVKALTEGQLMNIDCPIALFMTALVGTRRPGEYPDQVEGWYALTQKGVNPRLAAAVSELLFKQNRGRYRATVQDSGHQMFNMQCMGSDGFVELGAGRMISQEEKHVTPLRYRGYSQFNAAFTGTESYGSSVGDKIVEQFNSLSPKSAVSQSVWGEAVRYQYADSLEEWADTMIEAIKEISI